MFYFDNAATTKVDPNVSELLGNLFVDGFGNSSSSHKLGEKNKQALVKAKSEIASRLGCDSENIIITSGASESNNAVIANIANMATTTKNRVLVSPIEHPSVLEPLRHFEKSGKINLNFLRVGSNCIIDSDDLQNKIDNDVIAVVAMAVNNETGAVQPIETIAEICRQYDVVFHCDFVQGFGKVQFTPNCLDFASFSAHKVYGPKGIGILYVKNPPKFMPLIFGGGQQSNYRSGTEPIELIQALALTVNNLYDEFGKNNDHIYLLREHILEKLSDCPEVEINSPTIGVPHILNISIKGVRSDSLALVFYQNDIMLSQGSACSSNHDEKVLSHVLLAMGLPEDKIRSSFRISFGKTNSIEEIDYLVDVIKSAVSKYKVSR